METDDGSTSKPVMVGAGIAAVLVAITIISIWAGLSTAQLKLSFGVLVAVLVGAFGLVVVWLILTEKINLASLVSEASGKASLSRFQALIFTFVIAMSYFLLVLDMLSGHAGGVDCGALAAQILAETGPKLATLKEVYSNSCGRMELPDLPNGVLGLLGLSAGTYIIGKGLQKGDKTGIGTGGGSVGEGRFTR